MYDKSLVPLRFQSFDDNRYDKPWLTTLVAARQNANIVHNLYLCTYIWNNSSKKTDETFSYLLESLASR